MSEKFMEKYPNIKVKYENVGQGAPHYVKLRDALKAGTGLPDVAQMEFNSIASFRALNALEDMGTAGANDVKAGFVDWTWKSASDGDKVYGIPWDSGPMGLLYREDIFTRERPRGPGDLGRLRRGGAQARQGQARHLHVPTSPPATPAGSAPCSGRRAGGPFHLEGTDITIAINDPIAKDWANYWQKLIDAKAVDVAPVWTSEWFAGLDNGKYASWLTAAWGPALMASSMKASVGKWRAAKIPQWKAGEYVSSNWGGSTVAAMKGTPHLKEATLFATFMGADPEVARYWNSEIFLFPVLKEVLADPAVARPQVRLLRRPAGQPDLRRILVARRSELRVRAVPGLCEHPHPGRARRRDRRQRHARRGLRPGAGRHRRIRDRPGLHGEVTATRSARPRALRLTDEDREEHGRNRRARATPVHDQQARRALPVPAARSCSSSSPS